MICVCCSVACVRGLMCVYVCVMSVCMCVMYVCMHKRVFNWFLVLASTEFGVPLEHHIGNLCVVALSFNNVRKMAAPRFATASFPPHADLERRGAAHLAHELLSGCSSCRTPLRCPSRCYIGLCVCVAQAMVSCCMYSSMLALSLVFVTCPR